MRSLTITIYLLFLSGCVVIPPSEGIYAGNKAHYQGDYELALKNYQSALVIAQKQNYKPHIATAKYGLGRTYGQLCNFQLAEKYLKEAVELEEEISGGTGGYLTQDYLELARLYYDFGEYEEAIIYFPKAIPIVENFGIIESDPIGYANVLKDYQVALSKVGNSKESENIRSKIMLLESNNPGRSASFAITRFNTTCMLNK